MDAKTLFINKKYSAEEIESKIYDKWEKSGAFKVKIDLNKTPFTVVMPPPNITGQLHMGHAMDNLLQDAPVRYHRMKGDPTLWIPGTDHASIATEVKILDSLKQQGINKEDLSREEFLVKAWEWKKTYGDRINKQLRKLGVSCDWSHERFTMDEGCSKAVNKVFENLYNKDLIYQGNRMINWCPVCKTALSDAEVDYTEHDSHLWHIKYPVENSDQFIIIATTRPETMLGDTGVAVNPKDTRYTNLVGKNVILPIINKAIPIVADDYVDMEFGTGAVKMTPAHDPNDLEVAKRHNLEIIRINNDDGTINELGGKYQGLTAQECRKAIVDDLNNLGLLVKVDPHKHNVGECYRCHNVVEPIISKQWFLKMEDLAKPAIECVKNNSINIIPERFSKIYYNWMENIKDWCISRQLWWGHRIPAWHCDDCNKITVSADQITKCKHCGSSNIHQDEDVLDTWFSSALWPFSTLGWPEKNEELDYFYPTSLLVTGYDILFFWVARMIFSGIEHMGEIPFSTVLLHGLVRDSQGRKMSKSLGNGIDPLEIVEKYGADALRCSLVLGVTPGNDTRFSIEKVEAARNFANKVWNAAKFVLMNTERVEDIDVQSINLPSKWILNELQECIYKITNHYENFEFGLAAQEIYDFIWDKFCDWYIELSKSDLFSDDQNAKQNTVNVLNFVLSSILKLLHPIMPFITEEIYSNLPNSDGLIMLSEWPKINNAYKFTNEAQEMQDIMEVIKSLRNIRAEMNVAFSKKIRVFIVPKPGYKELYQKSIMFIKTLINISEYEILDSFETDAKYINVINNISEIYIPLGDLVNIEDEIKRLNKEKEKYNSELNRANGKLSNEGFTKKAPQALIEQEKTKIIKYTDLIKDIELKLDELRKLL